MKYELIKDSNMGVIIDSTPILTDIKDTFQVTFVLPAEREYIALFRSEEGIEYKTVIRNGATYIPKELIGKEQRIGLTVCELEGERIVHSWECHSLRVSAFLYLRQTQWQITAGVDDKELLMRFAELERIHTQTQTAFAELKDDYAKFAASIAESVECLKANLLELTESLATVRTANENVTKAYNKSVAAINELSNRLAALEANYDPTIIK